MLTYFSQNTNLLFTKYKYIIHKINITSTPAKFYCSPKNLFLRTKHSLLFEVLIKKVTIFTKKCTYSSQNYPRVHRNINILFTKSEYYASNAHIMLTYSSKNINFCKQDMNLVHKRLTYYS